MRGLLGKFTGGILLVSGTTIGAGMLALPVTAGFAGFLPTVVVFFVFWLVMLASSYLFLEVNLAMPSQSNMVTMAEKTLGASGKAIAWFVYLILLYSLTAAYIAGSTPLFADALSHIGLTSYLPGAFLPTILPTVFIAFIFLGTQGVDYVNRIFMLFLLFCYARLIGAAPADVNPELLRHVDWKATPVAFSVVITSFGYHIIIPTLTNYLERNRKQLKWTLFIGSLLPLAFFILWIWLALGIIPLERLAIAYEKGEGAVVPLAAALKSPKLILIARFFAFFAITTSFLGVTLSLSDFLTDGFNIPSSSKGRFVALLLTFVPPLIFVYSFQEGFILALKYAGICIAILLIIFPVLMAWKLKRKGWYHSFYGRLLSVFLIIFSVLLISLNILDQHGYLRTYIQEYLP